jgi:hypothetical protein
MVPFKAEDDRSAEALVPEMVDNKTDHFVNSGSAIHKF